MLTDNEMKAEKHEQMKEMIILVGGLAIVIICILTVGFLVYNSIIKNLAIPEYSIAFFTSITTLILGYLFGSKIIGGKK